MKLYVNFTMIARAQPEGWITYGSNVTSSTGGTAGDYYYGFTSGTRSYSIEHLSGDINRVTVYFYGNGSSTRRAPDGHYYDCGTYEQSTTVIYNVWLSAE